MMMSVKDDKQKKTFGDFVNDVREGGDNKQDDGIVNPPAGNLDNNDDDD